MGAPHASVSGMRPMAAHSSATSDSTAASFAPTISADEAGVEKKNRSMPSRRSPATACMVMSGISTSTTSPAEPK